MDFLQAFSVIGLAIAFVIGQAASKLITALVIDIINPLTDWQCQMLVILLKFHLLLEDLHSHTRPFWKYNKLLGNCSSILSIQTAF